MIPRVFVCSTIDDLHYLRDAVRQTILDLSFEPVMSDYGDVGYSPKTSVEDACYNTIKRCELEVLIVGKRYGEEDESGISITRQEFREAKSANVPLFLLIDSEVWSFKKVFDKNPCHPPSFPSMDNAKGTFDFINEIINSSIKNGILLFSSTPEACKTLKRQIALFFGDLLKDGGDAIAPQVKDILTEVKAHRHEPIPKLGEPNPGFLKAIRYLLDRQNRHFRNFLEILYGNVETALSNLADFYNISNFIKKAGWNREKRDPSSPELANLHEDYYNRDFEIPPLAPGGEYKKGTIITYPGKRLYLNSSAEDYLSKQLTNLCKMMRES